MQFKKIPFAIKTLEIDIQDVVFDTFTSFIKSLNEVDLKLPVIVMNGAALYELKNSIICFLKNI